jgi:hypothetical protein
VHATGAAASSLQVVETTDVVASVAVKVTGVLSRALDPFAGETIVTTGGTVSTTKVLHVGAPVTPELLLAFTQNM